MRFCDSYQTVIDLTQAHEFHSWQILDGAGRVRASASDHPGSTGGYQGQYVVYDNMGRVTQQSNPTEFTSTVNGWVATGDDAAWRVTTQTYDWKGRPKQTTNSDGSWNLYSYVGNSPLSFTDPLGLWKEGDCTGGRCFEAEKGDSLSTLATQYHLKYKDLVKQFGKGGIEVGQVLLVGDPGVAVTVRDEGPAVVQVFLVQPPREREEFQRAATGFIHKYLNPCPNPHVQCGVF